MRGYLGDGEMACGRHSPANIIRTGETRRETRPAMAARERPTMDVKMSAEFLMAITTWCTAINVHGHADAGALETYLEVSLMGTMQQLILCVEDVSILRNPLNQGMGVNNVTNQQGSGKHIVDLKGQLYVRMPDGTVVFVIFETELKMTKGADDPGNHVALQKRLRETLLNTNGSCVWGMHIHFNKNTDQAATVATLNICFPQGIEQPLDAAVLGLLKNVAGARDVSATKPGRLIIGNNHSRVLVEAWKVIEKFSDGRQLERFRSLNYIAIDGTPTDAGAAAAPPQQPQVQVQQQAAAAVPQQQPQPPPPPPSLVVAQPAARAEPSSSFLSSQSSQGESEIVEVLKGGWAFPAHMGHPLSDDTSFTEAEPSKKSSKGKYQKCLVVHWSNGEVTVVPATTNQDDRSKTIFNDDAMAEVYAKGLCAFVTGGMDWKRKHEQKLAAAEGAAAAAAADASRTRESSPVSPKEPQSAAVPPLASTPPLASSPPTPATKPRKKQTKQTARDEARVRDWVLLEQLLLQKGWRISDVGADGACLFKVVAFLFHGRSDCHQYLREELVKYVRENQSVFADSIINETLDQYCARMVLPATWGDDVMVSAAAFYCTIRFVVHTLQDGQVVEMPFHPASPSDLEHHLVWVDGHYKAMTRPQPTVEEEEQQPAQDLGDSQDSSAGEGGAWGNNSYSPDPQPASRSSSSPSMRPRETDVGGTAVSKKRRLDANKERRIQAMHDEATRRDPSPAEGPIYYPVPTRRSRAAVRAAVVVRAAGGGGGATGGWVPRDADGDEIPLLVLDNMQSQALDGIAMDNQTPATSSDEASSAEEHEEDEEDEDGGEAT